MASISSDSIKNFRDVAGSAKSSIVLKGRIFRSACLDNIDEDGLHYLISTCKICTLIDLRTPLEINSSDTLQAAFSRAPSLSPSSGLFRSIFPDLPEPLSIASFSSKKAEGTKFNLILPHKIRYSFNIDLMGVDYQMKAVWAKASFKTKLVFILYVMLFMKKTAVAYITKHVVKKNGLLGFYKDLIDFCKQQIFMTLKVILENAEEPFLVYCSIGKDRTAVIIALVLSIVGVPRHDIILDYGLSSKLLSPFQDQIEAKIEKFGLGKDFTLSREETMDSLLTYIETKYGSVLKYLGSIGFDQDRQNALRAKLLNAKKVAPR